MILGIQNFLLAKSSIEAETRYVLAKAEEPAFLQVIIDLVVAGKAERGTTEQSVIILCFCPWRIRPPHLMP